MEDERIIELFFERSEQAITELSIKYDSLIKSIINNVLNNSSDVEECTNDTYLSIWNTIPPQKPMNLAAYLARVAKNTALNRYDYNTSKKRYSSYDMSIDELAELIPSGENVEEKILVNELSQAINVFLAELSTKERVMFVARYRLTYFCGTKVNTENSVLTVMVGTEFFMFKSHSYSVEKRK